MADLADIIEPMPGLIAVRVETKDEITPQGLFIPAGIARSIHEARPNHGVVLAVGSTRGYDDEDEDDLLAELDPDADLGPPMQQPAQLAVGDHILFSKFTGTKISRMVTSEADGRKQRVEETVLIMRATDVLARIKQPSEASNLKVKA